MARQTKGNIIRVINPAKSPIKLTIAEDIEEKVSCQLCGKGFVSELALHNHVRVHHIEVYNLGDSSVWTHYNTVEQIQDQQKKIQDKTELLISSMKPTKLQDLASKEVRYILIKNEDGDSNSLLRPTKRKVERHQPDNAVQKKEKIAKPLTGPFECLQPSVLGKDGLCHQMFFSCCDYSVHFRDEHTRRRKGLRCQVCEKLLISGSEQLQYPYICLVCGEGYHSKKELTEHTNTRHIKLKPYECVVCHKRFTQQGGLQQHMRMHTGDRPFSCTICPKSFTQKSGLDQHLRTHTKVKPYRCVVCDKTFCQSVHLKQHMRTHTNVTPFECGICKKKFKQSSHLNYHLRGHCASMTEDQKEKYAKLLGVVDNASEMIEIEIDQNQADLIEQVEAARTIETVQKEDAAGSLSVYAQDMVDVEVDREIETDDIEYVEEVEEDNDGNEEYIISESGDVTIVTDDQYYIISNNIKQEEDSM